MTDFSADKFEHSEKEAYTEKHLADTHQENSDKIVGDCVGACVSVSQHVHEHARTFAYKNMNEDG